MTHPPCYAPTVPLPRYDAKPRPFAWSWAQERPSINCNELSLRRANASDVLWGALPLGPGRKTGSDLAHVPAVETLANLGVTARRDGIHFISKFTGGPTIGEAASASSVTKLKADAALIRVRAA